MFPWELHLPCFLLLLCLSRIGAVPPSPPKTGPTLKYKPSLNDDGLRHAWRGWDPIDLNPSQLEGYVEKTHDEMHAQSWKGGFREIDMPYCLAALHIPRQGIYSASDYGHRPLATPPQLHPNTQAILHSHSLRLDHRAGSCAEIQALDAYHRRFPDRPLPAGCCMAIWGRASMCHAPKLQTTCGRDCKKILQAKGITCLDKSKKKKKDIAKPRRRKQSKPMRAELGQGDVEFHAGPGPVPEAAARPFAHKLQTGRKGRKVINVDTASTDTRSPALGGPDPDPDPDPDPGKEINGAPQRPSSEDSRGTGATSPGDPAAGAAAHSIPGPDSEHPVPGQKHRSLGEIYQSDEVARILLQDLAHGE